MKSQMVCLLKLIIMVFLLIASASWAVAGDKQVLILNSYYQGYKWTDDVTRGIVTTLKASRQDITVSIEYMDTKRISNDQYFQTLFSIYQMKFKKQHFDLVITSDDDAYNFIRKYRDRLFGGTPVVFCGVNYFDPVSLKGVTNITGVNEEADIKAGLDIALKLHPSAKNVFCIIEKTTTGVKIHDRMVEIIRNYRPGIRFTLLEDLTMEELLEKVGNVPPDSIVFQTIFFRDSAGRNFSSDQVMGLLSKTCKVPLYGLWDFDLGLGIIGGMLTSGYSQGEDAANKGLRILAGEKTDNIPVLMQSPNRFMFDYTCLKKFGINLSNLPHDSIIINKPMGILDYYHKNRFFVLVMIIVSLSLIAGILLFSWIKLKNASHSVRMSEQRYRTIFENTGTAMGIFRNDGMLMLANSELEKLTGYAKSELENRQSWHDLTGENDLPYLKKCHAADGRNGPSNGFECRIRNRGGNLRDVYSLSECIPDTDLVVVSLIDITERKRAEEERLTLQQQFQQAQKLESLGVMAGGIAHDFNNILAVIMGYSSFGRQKPEKAAEFMPEIEKAAKRAAELCRQMLAYAGKTPFVESRVDVTALLYDMVSMLKSTLPRNVILNPSLSGDLPCIEGDAGQLRQVVMNLIINASEAIGDEQGEIRVELAKTTIGLERAEKDYLGKAMTPGPYLCLEVTDTGCGMDDETKQRLFEPFYTTKFMGRGLGMSAVLGIITAHKGALQFHSLPGRGTSFTVYLPVRNGDSAAESMRQSAPLPWRGSGTILLVEDEPQLMTVAKAMLETLGFSVIEASNGIEAIEQYRKNAADITLVVTDIDMPQMDGYQVVVTLKKLNPVLPIIISSGFGDSMVISKIAPEDRAGLISKPYDFVQLQEIFQRITRHAKPGPAEA